MSDTEANEEDKHKQNKKNEASGSNNTNSLQPLKIEKVATKVPIPTLNQDQVETWFLQLDQWFYINNVSEKMKFGTVVASLDAKVVNQVLDAVKNPPTTNQYEHLKQAVLNAYAESSQQRFQKLVSGIQLGDRRPSHLLNELRQVSDTADEKLLKNFWLSRLPVQIKTIVSASKGDLTELAAVADVVMDSMNLTINQTSVNPLVQQIQPQPTYDQCQIQQQLQELTRQVQQLSVARFPSSYASRSRSKSRDSQSSQKRNRTPSNRPTTCWYHREYGMGAKKCVKPCNFSQPANTSSS